MGNGDGIWYRCIYCKQMCSSVGILIAHEKECNLRAKKEAEWKHDRKRYVSHYGATMRWERHNGIKEVEREGGNGKEGNGGGKGGSGGGTGPQTS